MKKSFKKPYMIFLGLILLFSLKVNCDLAPKQDLEAPSESYYGACCQDNTVTVLGLGQVSIQPDLAYINIYINRVRETGQQAVQAVSQAANQIVDIVSSFGGDENDVITTSLYVYPNYSFENGTSIIVSYTAYAYMRITVRGINEDEGKLGSFLQAIGGLEGLSINYLSFDKEDKTQAQAQARELAFNDAKQKAKDYAKILGKSLGSVVYIVDNVYVLSAPLENAQETQNQVAPSGQNQQPSILPPPTNVFYQVTVRYYIW